MSVMDAQLTYGAVLQRAFGGLLSGDAERDTWVYREAEEMHALIVADAIREVAVSAVILADGALDRQAVFHLRYGVAHRAKFIWVALRRLMAIAPPGQTEPVSLDDVEALASDLNVIYLNIRGTLDNLAWAVRAQRPSDAAGELRDQQMDLFGDRFLAATGDDELRAVLEPYRNWYADLKGRRDPAAHRIPLSVPPTMLDDAAQQEYADLDRRHGEAMAKALAATRKGLDEEPDKPLSSAAADDLGAMFDEAGAIHTKRQTVGRFPGLFAHHPDEPAMPIYPTVAEDIGTLVAISRAVFGIIERGRDVRTA